MKNSESLEDRARRLIGVWQTLLDSAHVDGLIDAPIDQAALSFRSAVVRPRSHREFHAVLGAFVAHVYRHVASGARRLSRLQARALALSLLSGESESPDVDGYEAALLAAFSEIRGGLPLALDRLAQTIKNRRRREYLRWVWQRHLDPADWELRCAVARILFDEFRRHLPEGEPHPAPEDLAANLPELLDLALASVGR